MPKLTFHQGLSRGDQVVTLDDVDISSAVRSLSFKVAAGEVPEVSIQPSVFEFGAEPSEIELGMAATKIHIFKEAVDLLVRLGWTPPAAGEN